MAHLRLELITLSLIVMTGVLAKPPKYYMDQRCGDTLTISSLPSIRLDLTRNSKYRDNMNCILTVRAAPTSRTNTTTNKRLMLVFRELDIKGSDFFGCDSDDDLLYIYDGPSTSAPAVPGLAKSFCGENEPRGAYMSSGDSLTFRFKSDSWNTDDGFKLLITPFHTGTCTGSEYRCDRGQCIANGNKCDGYKQCGDYADECEVTRTTEFPKRTGPSGIPVWIAGRVIGIIVVLAVIGVAVFCLRRYFRNRQNSGGTVKYTAPHQQTPAPYYQQPGTAPGYYPQASAPPPQGYPQIPAYSPQNQTYPPPYPEQQQGYPPQANPYPYGAPTTQ